MKAKILVIDDEENIRFTFQEFLLKVGYDVYIASEYNKAMDMIKKSDFDLIFVDILLNGKSGIDVLRCVKDRKQNSLVIMITGAPNVETTSEALRLGAFDYIPKPVLKETLLHAAKRALRHKKLVDEKDKYRSNLEAIFKSVKDAIITVDSDMSLIEINEAAKKICNLSRDSIGKPLCNITKFCAGECVEFLQKTIKKKRPIEIYRFECKHKRRPHQIMTINTYPLVNNKGVFTGAVLVGRDETQLEDLEKEMKERRRFHNIIGKSAKMQKIYSIIEHLADVPTTVLITGESGTGKELVAEALHYRGPRSSKALVKVNCSALSESLLESELFGHVKGSFTGAIKNRKGRFEIANEGTVFLDEIGDITIKMQTQLLRFIQDKIIERIGESKAIEVDVRIVAATHQNLLEKIMCGEFRKDLYYRLKVVEIDLPPLRSRKEDIPLLIDHFLNKFNKMFKKEIEGISVDVQKIFMHYSWPGNVRELEHALEHAFILCHQKVITAKHLPDFFKKPKRTKALFGKDPMSKERMDIFTALKSVAWNKSKAAGILGISRSSLYRKIKGLSIKK